MPARHNSVASPSDPSRSGPAGKRQSLIQPQSLRHIPLPKLQTRRRPRMETKDPKCAMTLRQNHPDLRIKLTLSRRDMATTKAPNPDRRSFLLGSLAAGAATALSAESHATNTASAQESNRAYWLQQVELVSDPVLKALKEGNLRQKMPVEA